MKKALAVGMLSFLVICLCPEVKSQKQFYYTERSAGLNEKVSFEAGKTEVEFADVNNDDKLDILTIGDHRSAISSQHGIMVWFGNGGSSWNDFSQVGNFGYGGIAIGDVNKDGKMDVGYGQHHNYSSTDFGDQILEVAIGDGTGKNWTPYDDNLASNGESWGMSATDFGDVNGDGLLDIGSLSFGAGNGIRVYKNDGDGSWTQTFEIDGGNAASGFEFGDANNDGKLDLCSGHASGLVYLGNGNGGFTLSSLGLPSSQPFGMNHVRLRDIDGQPGDELIFINRDGEINVAKLNGNAWTILSVIKDAEYSCVEPADMDSDGLGDLVAFKENAIVILKGNGGTSWIPLTFIPSESMTGTDISINDVDGSGYPDILVMSEEVSGSPFAPIRKHTLRFYLDSVVEVATGIEDPLSRIEHQVFPNPLTNNSVITFTLQRQEQVNLQLTDISGRVIKQLLNESLPSGKHFINLGSGRLPAGTYFSRLKVGIQKEDVRIVVVP